MFKPKFSGSSNNFDTGFKTQKNDFDTDFDGYEVLQGEDGKSAYEIACEYGFEGTEEEWLETLKGDQGPTGETGPQGANGEDGEDGVGVEYITLSNEGKLIFKLTDGRTIDLGNVKGPIGPQGPIGSTGPEGPAGAQGPQGPEGPQGIQGVQGEKGEKGDKGDKGDVGPQGAAGVAGPEGPQGPQGVQGLQGPRGEKGEPGERGEKGETGEAGKDGVFTDEDRVKVIGEVKVYVDEEDKFETDILTVNALGGIAAGDDLNGKTTHEILKKLLYPYVAPSLGSATASPQNGGTYEKGVKNTITSVSITITKKSESITKVALYNGSTLIEEKTGDTVKNGGTFTFSNVNIEVPTNGNQLTVKVTDAANKTYEKKTNSMTFVYPYYMGPLSSVTDISEEDIEGLTKKIESKGQKSHSYTINDQHIVFAYPKEYGVLKSIIDPNGYETINGYSCSELPIKGLDDSTQTYYVYKSTTAGTSTGFTVTFKY